MSSAELGRPSQYPSVKPTLPRTRAPRLFVGGTESPDQALIRRLALDRLRDLHDDGVTMSYIGRMYGVSGDRMREIEALLRQ